ncbi:MAG: P1 family peptidase [Bacteriovoracaceae bacterium]
MPLTPFKKLNFDFNDFKVGTAEYKDAPTGCTLFAFPKPATCLIDMRGGACAVRESSSVDEVNTWGTIDALMFAGGSSYGLEAADGLMKSLLKERKSTHFEHIPAVPAAIIYDFSKRKEELIYPDSKLGEEAYKNLKTNQIDIGRAGAGINATVGKYLGRDFSEYGGQGAAFINVGGIKLFAFTVLNSLGNIYNEKNEIIAGSLDPKTGRRVDLFKHRLNFHRNKKVPAKKENTTISAIITNAQLDRLSLKRLSIMVHTSMAQSIRPFHTPYDGDTLFAVSTQTKKMPIKLNVTDLSIIAADLMNDAIHSIFSAHQNSK